MVNLGATVPRKMKLLTMIEDSLKSMGSGVTASQGTAYLLKTAVFSFVRVLAAVQDLSFAEKTEGWCIN